MTAPRSIDHAVAVLFRAIAGHARGDRQTVMAAHTELIVLAADTEGFEAQLATAIVDRLAPSLPNATRNEVEQAVRVDIFRHVTNPIFLAKIEPWGTA